MTGKWQRVDRQIKCPVCRKDHWCTIGEKWICCMRVQSDRPCKNGGWLHAVGDKPIARPVRSEPELVETRDFAGMLAGWRADCLTAFAATLGIEASGLDALRCVWAPEFRAWAFPMSDGWGNVIGIRLRNDAGHKWAVRGSKQGLFITSNPAPQTAFVCEGPTDTAAILTLGLWAVGRPSCLGGNDHLKLFLKRRGVKQAVLLADNDKPGIQGAQRLASEIGIPSALLVLPAKDSRAFVQLGGTRQMIETLLHDTCWRRP